ncbi:MAG: hypothetical protein HZB91_06585 [Elusimicrobia bacterium]|nr:hypothetical protein [Elusimicrobiota bacterium]
MKNLVFAGLILAMAAPANGEGISVGVSVGRVSLPSYPVPVTSINRYPIQLPSPVLPTFATPGLDFRTTLPTPVTVPIARLPEPVLPPVVTLPDPVILPAPLPWIVGGPIGPSQYPRPVSPNPDPLPIQVPITVKSKFAMAKVQASQGKFEAASANLKAMFDNSEKPAAPAVNTEEEKPADKSEPVVRSERRVTLPEWDLEQELGINPAETTW